MRNSFFHQFSVACFGAVAFLSLNGIQAQSEREVLLVNKYQPNKKYVQQTTQRSDMLVRFENAPASMPAESMRTSMLMNGNQELKTEAVNPQGFVPFEASISQKLSLKVNGEPQKTPSSDFGNFTYRGRFDSAGAITVDTIRAGKGLSEQLRTTINSFSRNMQLPNQKIKVGGKLTQKVPFQMNEFSGELLMKYHLDSIVGNKAFFSIDMNMDMDIPNPQMSLKGNAKGPGKMTYLISEQMVDYMNNELNMSLKGSMGEMTVLMNGKTESTVQVRME
ncbi:MAG: hypothetical protein RLZZ370_1157 [Bacteroidota bacterium]|jgi:hypothetical protein